MKSISQLTASCLYKLQTSKSTSSGAWVTDVTLGFMAWRRWVIRLPRVKRCLCPTLRPSGTCLSSPRWSLRPWRPTPPWLRLSSRAHSKITLHISVCEVCVQFHDGLVQWLMLFHCFSLIPEKPYDTCRHSPSRHHRPSSPSSSLWTSWRRWMDFSSG